jgi:hypothetical protein
MAGIDAHSTSDAGISAKVSGNDGNVTEVTENEAISLASKSQGVTSDNLPANQNPGLINWFGSSYTGQDIQVVAHLYEPPETPVEGTIQGEQTLTLGTLQTISIQSHREKFAVRALGHSYPKGFCRGTRTLAGSMIFTVFSEHPLLKLIRVMGGQEKIWRDPEIASLLPDQLPPIDLTIVFANEYGSLSRLNIYGVEFINDGVTFSIENLLSEQVMNFVCRDADVMTTVGQMRLSRATRGLEQDRDATASSLLGTSDYIKYLDRLKVRRRSVSR